MDEILVTRMIGRNDKRMGFAEIMERVGVETDGMRKRGASALEDLLDLVTSSKGERASCNESGH